MAFPGVMYRCESWTKGWASKNRCFQTVVLEKTLEGALDCKQIKPVNPKGNQPWPFIKGLILKLKLQNFDHLMQRTDSLEKTLMLGKIEGKRRRGRQRMRWLDSITDSINKHEFEQTLGAGEGPGSLASWGPWGCKEEDMTWQLNNSSIF